MEDKISTTVYKPVSTTVYKPKTMYKPKLRFFAVLLGQNGSSCVLYDDNDLDCEALKDILEVYG